MDPQKLSQLDPKLREAYQRVMGTVIPEPQAAPIQAQTSPPAASEPSTPIPNPTPTPQPEPEPIPISTPEPSQTEPVPAPNTEPTIAPQPPADQKREPFFIPQPETPPTGGPTPQPDPIQQASNFVQMNSEVPATPTAVPAPTPNFATPVQSQTIAIKKKNNILIPAMIVITILVFIVVYGLFWARIFNLKLPFLP